MAEERVAFREATERALEAGVSLAELAEELGVSHSLLRKARFAPDNPNRRRPPEGWREALARLARRRGGQLLELAEDLERGS